MGTLQKHALVAEAGVALNTVNRYLSGKNVMRSSKAVIEAALKRLGWDSFIRPEPAA